MRGDLGGRRCQHHNELHGSIEPERYWVPIDREALHGGALPHREAIRAGPGILWISGAKPSYVTKSVIYLVNRAETKRGRCGTQLDGNKATEAGVVNVQAIDKRAGR